jgi:hypothetical protein
MFRYGFSIKTRSGQRVENISIMAPSQPDAERRLRQMYRLCEILECHTNALPRRSETLDVENVISMICAHPALETSPIVRRAQSADKARAS